MKLEGLYLFSLLVKNINNGGVFRYLETIIYYLRNI